MPLTARQVDGTASLSFPQRSRGVLHVGSACSPENPICREHAAWVGEALEDLSAVHMFGSVGPAREVEKSKRGTCVRRCAGGRGSGGSFFMPKRGTRAGGVHATGETLLKI